MAKGIEIGVGVDTKAAKQAIETGLVDPLEDAQEALDDLGKSRGPERLERDLKGAQKATDRLQDETEETARAIEREYKKAYREAKQAADDGLSGMSEAGREVGDELRQNLGETFSSFRGDLEDLPQIAQDTLGGLAGSGALGGIPGLAATAAGAAGLGLIIGALDEAGKKQEALEQAASGWADAYIEAGGRIINAAQQVAMYNEIATDPEKYAEAKKNAETWGVSIGVAINAMAGSTWALDEAQESLAAKQQTYLETAEKYREAGTEWANPGWEASYKAGQDALDTITGAMERGGAQADAYSESLRLMAERTAGATKEVDEFGDTVYTLPDETKVYIDAETGKATQSIDAIEKRIYGLPDAELKVNLTHNADDTIAAMHRKLANANLQMRIKLKEDYGKY